MTIKVEKGKHDLIRIDAQSTTSELEWLGAELTKIDLIIVSAPDLANQVWPLKH